jgi:NADH-ubiquinone oxidoreductase chain 6
MFNLYIFPDIFNGYSVVFLDLLMAISLLAGIFTIISKNPIVSVLHLILLFSSISVYLILIGIKFIGISYLLVYVGAVSILFLFILMLINIRVSELTSDTYNYVPLAIFTIIFFFLPLNSSLPNINFPSKENFQIYEIFSNSKNLNYVSSSNWEENFMHVSDIETIGNIMYGSYSIWLIITSIILLLAMVGSIVITIKQRF